MEQLELLRRREPKLKWIEVSESDSEALLARLSEGKVDYVVADAHTLDLVRRFHPDRNGGDRRHEKKLGQVIDAWQTLKIARAFAA